MPSDKKMNSIKSTLVGEMRLQKRLRKNCLRGGSQPSARNRFLRRREVIIQDNRNWSKVMGVPGLIVSIMPH